MARAARAVPPRRSGAALALLATAGAARAEPAAEPAAEPVEVVVEGERRPAGSTSLGRVEARQIPGAFGDPFRAVEAMPGITPIVSGAPYFYVRGAPPGNVGYFVDGIRVPLLYHVALGPSVVHPGILEKVELHPGGYPARYGRFAGAIVAGETSEPRSALHGEAGVRLIDAGALVEAPLAAGRVSVLGGGRWSYTGLLLQALSPEVLLEYWDWQARASWAVGSRDTLSLFGFGARDLVGARNTDGAVRNAFGTEFHRIDLREDHVFSDDTSARLATTLGLDRTIGIDEDRIALVQQLYRARLEVRHRLRPGARLRAGADAEFDRYEVAIDERFGDDPSDEAELARVLPPRDELTTGAWLELELHTARGLTLSPGLRLDVYAAGGVIALGVDPRVAARIEATRSLRLLHAFGVAHQPPSFFVPVPGLQPFGLREGLQRSLQYSSGFELELPWDVLAAVTAFQNVFLNMTDTLALARSPIGDEQGLTDRSLGSAIGLELSLRRPLTRAVGGFLAYTLSRSTRSVGRWHLPHAFDRTHVVSAAVAVDLGRRWRAGTRSVFYTGFPRELEVTPDGDVRDRGRSPAFWRQDVRLEKRWPIGAAGAWWAVVAEVLNASLQEESVTIDCGPLGCSLKTSGPLIVPSLGVEAAF